ncbi:transcription elongation factor TFIIS [Indivirus ILV1]|uniref:Transcription elongation factor TFIIS n=1 Tax=Indivirus ILV1 TaxID=1977633 RepID=A0A1V0SDJ8_9VIRU|nr:transcription elongation factor TFIIS [Indivirus ILV1]
MLGDINLITKKAENTSPVENNLNYITSNIKNVDKSKISYLAENIDRINSISQFSYNLKNIDGAIKLEAGIFEFTLVYSLMKNYIKTILPAIYNDKVNDLLRNLDPNNSIGNNKLRDSINNGEIEPQRVAFLTPQELHPDRWELLIKKNKLREEKKKNMATTDIYQCYKCKGRRCTMTELQLRSADEPMTKIITCLDCYTVMKR